LLPQSPAHHSWCSDSRPFANNADAGGIGTLLAERLSRSTMNGWPMVATLALMANWILVPDKLDESEIGTPKKDLGVFDATVFAFFQAGADRRQDASRHHRFGSPTSRHF
jgi:putative Ca2+/H+ antiporter (TMEM165/GDT1 family)